MELRKTITLAIMKRPFLEDTTMTALIHWARMLKVTTTIKLSFENNILIRIVNCELI